MNKRLVATMCIFIIGFSLSNIDSNAGIVRNPNVGTATWYQDTNGGTKYRWSWYGLASCTINGSNFSFSNGETTQWYGYDSYPGSWFSSSSKVTSITGAVDILQSADGFFDGFQSLKSVSPGMITYPFGSYTFRNCNKLESIVYNKASQIGTGTHRDNTSLKSIKFNDGKHTTEIGNYGLYNCSNLSELDISYLTTVGNMGLYNCSKLNVNSLNDLSKVGESAFYNVNLSNITNLSELVDVGDSAFEDSNFNLNCELNKLVNVGNKAFKNSKLNINKLSNSIKNIGEEAFYNTNSNINKIHTCNITEMGDRAFYGNDIKSLNVYGNGVFNAKAFDVLEELVIGDSVNKFGQDLSHLPLKRLYWLGGVDNMKIEWIPNGCTIYVEDDSEAKNYFNNNGIPYQIINSDKLSELRINGYNVLNTEYTFDANSNVNFEINLDYDDICSLYFDNEEINNEYWYYSNDILTISKDYLTYFKDGAYDIKLCLLNGGFCKFKLRLSNCIESRYPSLQPEFIVNYDDDSYQLQLDLDLGVGLKQGEVNGYNAVKCGLYYIYYKTDESYKNVTDYSCYDSSNKKLIINGYGSEINQDITVSFKLKDGSYISLVSKAIIKDEDKNRVIHEQVLDNVKLVYYGNGDLTVSALEGADGVISYSSSLWWDYKRVYVNNLIINEGMKELCRGFGTYLYNIRNVTLPKKSLLKADGLRLRGYFEELVLPDSLYDCVDNLIIENPNLKLLNLGSNSISYSNTYTVFNNIPNIKDIYVGRNYNNKLTDYLKNLTHEFTIHVPVGGIAENNIKASNFSNSDFVSIDYLNYPYLEDAEYNYMSDEYCNINVDFGADLYSTDGIKSLYLNGEDITDKIIVENGIITLSRDTLENLADGKYIIDTIFNNDIESNSYLTIKDSIVNRKKPSFGEKGNIIYVDDLSDSFHYYFDVDNKAKIVSAKLNKEYFVDYSNYAIWFYNSSSSGSSYIYNVLNEHGGYFNYLDVTFDDPWKTTLRLNIMYSGKKINYSFNENNDIKFPVNTSDTVQFGINDYITEEIAVVEDGYIDMPEEIENYNSENYSSHYIIYNGKRHNFNLYYKPYTEITEYYYNTDDTEFPILKVKHGANDKLINIVDSYNNSSVSATNLTRTFDNGYYCYALPISIYKNNPDGRYKYQLRFNLNSEDIIPVYLTKGKSIQTNIPSQLSIYDGNQLNNVKIKVDNGTITPPNIVSKVYINDKELVFENLINGVVINSDELSELFDGEYTFYVELDDKRVFDTARLKVINNKKRPSVDDNTPPEALTTISYEFYKDYPDYVVIPFKFNSATEIIEISLDNDMLSEDNWKIQKDAIVLDKEYLSTLDAGKYRVLPKFNDKNNTIISNLKLIIYDKVSDRGAPYLLQSRVVFKGQDVDLEFDSGYGDLEALNVLALQVDDKLVLPDGDVVPFSQSRVKSIKKAYNSLIEESIATSSNARRASSSNARRRIERSINTIIEGEDKDLAFYVDGDIIRWSGKQIDSMKLSVGNHLVGAVFDNSEKTMDLKKVILTIEEDEDKPDDKPNEGDKPDKPENPSEEESKPLNPSKPSEDESKPSSPSEDESKPSEDESEPSSPVEDETEPSKPDKSEESSPSEEETQPSEPDEGNNPSKPDKPSEDESKPISPSKPDESKPDKPSESESNPSKPNEDESKPDESKTDEDETNPGKPSENESEPSKSDKPSNGGTSSSSKKHSSTSIQKPSLNKDGSINSTYRPLIPNDGGTWLEDKRTYILPSGEKAKSTWIADGKNWYYFDDNSKLVTDWWLTEGNTWYMLDKRQETFGACLYGWYFEKMDNKWYFFDVEDGHMLTGWQYIDGKWYYFTKNNEGQTYFGNNEIGWVYNDVNNTKPYGSMFSNENTPDGYTVNQLGELIK